jgi:hypothetical protein
MFVIITLIGTVPVLANQPTTTGTGRNGRVYVVERPAPIEDVTYDPSPVGHAGPTCTMVTVVLHLIPPGYTWVLNGVSYQTGFMHCSDGTIFLRTICVANCPNGSAFYVLPEPEDMPNLIPYFTPTPRLSPTLEHARTGTIGGYLVGIPMYLAVQPDQWHDLTATADVNGQWITVVAHPMRLEFTVGDKPISCDGPGEIVTGATWRTTTSTCSHLFTKRGDATLTMRIVYEHTYTSNFATGLPVGETGQSPAITETLPVVESQVIITRID